jgi:hypothetical protein
MPDNLKHFARDCNDSLFESFFRQKPFEDRFNPVQRPDGDVSKFNEDPSDMS